MKGPSTALSAANPTMITPFDMNPAKCNRRDYTAGLIAAPLPDSAAASWTSTVEKLRAVYGALGAHAAMEPNLNQTFNTPANSKNKVYFMWDFVGRALHFAYLVPASLNGLSREEQERWSDVLAKSQMAKGLLLDQMPGMLDMMSGSSNSGEQVELGEEVQQAAAQL